eukprot:CAMPEP_0114528466 /NCGR_PEP_ID=MMETSP0109-20121206/24230_1 /TAXON_ID=29199 /ORGANISM="Chlorarachnion reptans, Strain CCCM449" /LENGTH=154 /DNA_ID=CAMNT_0001710631 /DNA_START=244 /DNA_END=708 /DNA_ORIENTATION=+
MFQRSLHVLRPSMLLPWAQLEGDESEMASDDSYGKDLEGSSPRPLNFDPAREAAWRSVKKPLLRLGSAGIQDSHANSLLELLMSHGLVKVKFNMHSKDLTLKEYANMLMERANEVRPTKYSQVKPMILAEKEYQRIVLFASSSAAGEAMSASQK